MEHANEWTSITDDSCAICGDKERKRTRIKFGTAIIEDIERAYKKDFSNYKEIKRYSFMACEKCAVKSGWERPSVDDFSARTATIILYVAAVCTGMASGLKSVGMMILSGVLFLNAIAIEVWIYLSRKKFKERFADGSLSIWEQNSIYVRFSGDAEWGDNPHKDTVKKMTAEEKRRTVGPSTLEDLGIL